MGTHSAGASELSASANVFKLGQETHSVRTHDRGGPPELRTVAMWNLDHAYSAETLRSELWAVDFEPEDIILHDNPGDPMWEIKMPTAGMAMAMQTVFDEIDPEEKVLEPARDDTGIRMNVRVVQWREMGIPVSKQKTESRKPPNETDAEEKVLKPVPLERPPGQWSEIDVPDRKKVSFAIDVPDKEYIKPLLRKKENFDCSSW